MASTTSPLTPVGQALTTLTPDDLLRYFPPVACPIQPMEDRVVIQLRKPPLTNHSSVLIIGDSDREMERWSQCVGKLLKIGKLAQETAADWGIAEGDFVRIPVYGGDRIEVPTPEGFAFTHPNPHVKDEIGIILVTVRLHEVLSKITVDPREIKTFLPTKKFN